MLTIAIPTYNRADKVKRLLSVIREEVFSSRLQDRVAVIVSNNASTDKTHSVLSQFLNCGLKLEYYRQPDNLGFDRNLRFLYMQATTKYVWFMADDDLPLQGAVAKIVSALEMYDPDVLLFSFIQPPGSTVRQFDYPEPIHLVTNPVTAIEHIRRYPKLSIHIMRKVSFRDSQWQALDEHLGGGWYYMPLAFSVLESSGSPRLAIISEQLATCDEDYNKFNFKQNIFLEMYKVFNHPFVLKYLPKLVKKERNNSYLRMIQFLFAVKAGSLIVDDIQLYEQMIKNTENRLGVLLINPKALLQLLLMKIDLVKTYLKIRPIINYTRRITTNKIFEKPSLKANARQDV